MIRTPKQSIEESLRCLTKSLQRSREVIADKQEEIAREQRLMAKIEDAIMDYTEAIKTLEKYP